jgi:hypothetical protein
LILTGKYALTFMRQICGNCCGKGGHAKSAEFSTAISLDFKTRKCVEKNLRLHKSRALTLYALALGSHMSMVERVSQT